MHLLLYVVKYGLGPFRKDSKEFQSTSLAVWRMDFSWDVLLDVLATREMSRTGVGHNP